MTLEQDHNWLIRLFGVLIWFVMFLSLSVEIFALIGWTFGHAKCGAWIGVLLNGPFGPLSLLHI